MVQPVPHVGQHAVDVEHGDCRPIDVDRVVALVGIGEVAGHAPEPTP